MNTNPRTPMYAQLRGYLAERIAKGDWKPNDRLPPELELAERFGVSRITVRKALETMVEEGVIYRVQGKGTFLSGALPGEPPLLRPAAAGLAADAKPAAPAPAVAFLIPSLQDLFSADLLCGLEETLSERGVKLIVAITRSPEREKETIRQMVGSGVQGIVVFPCQGQSYNEEILKLTLDRYAIVVIDRYLREIETNCICSDNADGAYRAIAHLSGQGHRRIAFLSPPVSGTTSLEDRVNGYKQAVSDYGLHDDPELIGTVRSEETIADFLDRHPDVTAIVAGDQQTGGRILTVARTKGLAVPEKLSLISFDEFEYPELMSVPLTIVDQQPTRIGTEAAALVLKLMHNPDLPRQKLVLPVRLVERSSVGACPV